MSSANVVCWIFLQTFQTYFLHTGKQCGKQWVKITSRWQSRWPTVVSGSLRINKPWVKMAKTWRSRSGSRPTGWIGPSVCICMIKAPILHDTAQFHSFNVQKILRRGDPLNRVKNVKEITLLRDATLSKLFLSPPENRAFLQRKLPWGANSFLVE